MGRLGSGLLALVLVGAASRAEAVHPHLPRDGSPPGFFVGTAGGAMVPLGAWAAGAGSKGNPPGTPEIVAGAGGRVFAGWAPAGSRLFAVQADLGYAHLGARGPDGRAGLWSGAVGGTVDLPGRGRGRWALELHGAVGVVVPVGGPDGGGSYGFLETTLFGRTGARLVARLENGFDAFLGLDLLTAPGAVDHPGQEKRSIVVLEPALGLRYWFGP
jgi:hypothetical protein